MFQSRKRFRHCWSEAQIARVGDTAEFQSRKRFRHCWSSISASVCASRAIVFQSRKRFRHCWSAYRAVGHNSTHPVSIAKAIPSLLEHGRPAARRGRLARFNRESDSVTVGASPFSSSTLSIIWFQSRKRFRHCWSRG